MELTARDLSAIKAGYDLGVGFYIDDGSRTQPWRTYLMPGKGSGDVIKTLEIRNKRVIADARLPARIPRKSARDALISDPSESESGWHCCREQPFGQKGGFLQARIASASAAELDLTFYYELSPPRPDEWSMWYRAQEDVKLTSMELVVQKNGEQTFTQRAMRCIENRCRFPVGEKLMEALSQGDALLLNGRGGSGSGEGVRDTLSLRGANESIGRLHQLAGPFYGAEEIQHNLEVVSTCAGYLDRPGNSSGERKLVDETQELILSGIHEKLPKRSAFWLEENVAKPRRAAVLDPSFDDLSEAQLQGVCEDVIRAARSLPASP